MVGVGAVYWLAKTFAAYFSRTQSGSYVDINFTSVKGNTLNGDINTAKINMLF